MQRQPDGGNPHLDGRQDPERDFAASMMVVSHLWRRGRDLIFQFGSDLSLLGKGGSCKDEAKEARDQ